MYREAFYRCLSTAGCGSVLPTEEEIVNTAFDHVYGNQFLPEPTKQFLGDQIQRQVDADPRKAEFFRYVHEYATLTKVEPNVPTEADYLYVMNGGSKLYLMNNGQRVTKAGFSSTKTVPKYATQKLYDSYKALWDELV